MDYNFSDYFTVDECKRQLRVFHDEDNNDIVDKAEMSLSIIADHINRDIYPIGFKIPDGDETSINFNKSIRAACMLLLTDLFENRVISFETTASKNQVFDMILAPYFNFAVRMV